LGRKRRKAVPQNEKKGKPPSQKSGNPGAEKKKKKGLSKKETRPITKMHGKKNRIKSWTSKEKRGLRVQLNEKY